MVVSLLTATAYAYRPDGIRDAIIVQVVSWVAQFLGHGLAEGRAPALLDNILGGTLSIAYFVHGYYPSFQPLYLPLSSCTWNCCSSSDIVPTCISSSKTMSAWRLPRL